MDAKQDFTLGKKVQAHLSKLGLETPMLPASEILSDTEKMNIITEAMSNIMLALGLDLRDDSLSDTPKRIAKMYVHELFKGLSYSNFPKCTTIENKMDAGMVIEDDIKVMSTCEHHLVVIDGVATVAYIPKNKVIGLSKLNRVVDFFSRRPQVQERLTNQIWHTLSYILDTEDVAVYIDAVHFCVRSRGVEDSNSHTITSRLGGAFKNDAATRNEFMSLARGKR